MGKPTTRSVTQMNWKLRFEFASGIPSLSFSLVSFSSRETWLKRIGRTKEVSRIIAEKFVSSTSEEDEKLSFSAPFGKRVDCVDTRRATLGVVDAATLFINRLCSFSCRTTFEKRVSTFLFSYPLFPLISFPFFIFHEKPFCPQNTRESCTMKRRLRCSRPIDEARDDARNDSN